MKKLPNIQKQIALFMHSLRPFTGAIILLFTFSCSVRSDRKCLNSFELGDTGDTINIIDCKGLQQGHWIISKVIMTDKTHAKMIKIEEGFFRDNKKEGFWKFFNTDGSIKDSLEYKDDVPMHAGSY